MLCKSCIGITLKALRSQPGYPHSDSFNGLETSSKTCSLCALLWNAASTYGLFKRRSAVANSEDTVYLHVEEAGDDKLLRTIQLVTQPESADDVWDDIPGFTLQGFSERFGAVALYSDTDSPAARIVTSQRAALTADSEAAFATVHCWLWDCSTNHPNCPVLPTACLKHVAQIKDNQDLGSSHRIVEKLPNKRDSLGVLPSRLLDVGPSDGSQEPHLQVFEKPTMGLWIALSHCWGTLPLLRTTAKTLTSHLSKIPMSSLPPSFRDAVVFSRKLGIRYLWIDSLCIIQDDLEDWRIESAQMARIYGMSFLTIVAAGASNSHGGLFIPRRVRFPPALLHPSDSPGPFYAAEYITDSGDFPRSLDLREPIDRRGWCLQEALLPKRTLYYGTKMMTWRCQSGSFPEQGGHHGHKTQPLTLYHELERKRFGYSRWEYIVQEYTQRSLTKEKDKLIALAGIAEELSRIWSDTYLAGLWKGDIIRQLLWQRDGGINKTTGLEVATTRPTAFCAPSWSWAAINGSVIFRAHWLRDYDALTSLVRAEVVPIGDNLFGEISSGTLKLKGPMERVTGTWEFLPRHNHLATVTSGLTSELKTTCFLDVTEQRDWPSTELWCIRMVSKLCGPDWIEEDLNILVLNVYAILLVPTGKAEDEYMRVGIAKLDFDSRQTSRVATITII